MSLFYSIGVVSWHISLDNRRKLNHIFHTFAHWLLYGNRWDKIWRPWLNVQFGNGSFIVQHNIRGLFSIYGWKSFQPMRQYVTFVFYHGLICHSTVDRKPTQWFKIFKLGLKHIWLSVNHKVRDCVIKSHILSWHSNCGQCHFHREAKAYTTVCWSWIT